MPAWVSLLFVALNCFVIPKSSYQTPLGSGAKKLSVEKYEDYTFEGVLSRAKEECSYMSLVNDTVVRNKTLQMIKEKITHKNLKEFYEQKEMEKQRAKEYYENVEKQSRRRMLEGSHPQWNPNYVVPRPFPPLPPPPPPPAFLRRNLYKRSTDLHGRRRKGSISFSEVSFTDHNNCSSRCLFARMEMVNARGFPDESLITKLIDEKIPNRKLRLLKTKKVDSCFKKMEEGFSTAWIWANPIRGPDPNKMDVAGSKSTRLEGAKLVDNKTAARMPLLSDYMTAHQSAGWRFLLACLCRARALVVPCYLLEA